MDETACLMACLVDSQLQFGSLRWVFEAVRIGWFGFDQRSAKAPRWLCSAFAVGFGAYYASYHVFIEIISHVNH